uniref:RNase H type-1 domain-containing protein n=1 Tax=Cannabis sativa TaxID=3483 RepID=A0A803Q460_CANSA
MEIISATWLHPPTGCYMCNIDVAMGENRSVGAAIFRIDDGSITHIHTTRIMQCDPLAGELYTLCWGAVVAAKLALKHVTFQSDSKGAVEAIKGINSKDFGLHYNITDLVVRFHTSAKNFDLWDVCWIPRKLNCVAHDVAKWAIRSCRFEEIELSNFDSFLRATAADGCCEFTVSLFKLLFLICLFVFAAVFWLYTDEGKTLQSSANPQTTTVRNR